MFSILKASIWSRLLVTGNTAERVLTNSFTNSYRLFFSAILACGLAAPAMADGGLKVLAMGDSLLASHKVSGRSVTGVMSRFLGVRVVDHSVAGARMLYKLPITGSMGFNISKQFRRGDWDWIVLNGGGNDLWFGCGCKRCDRKINRLIAKNGARGEIPKLVRKLRSTGAQVVYVGYLRSPGVGSPIEHCRDEGDELERRIAALAETDAGIHFLSLADMVPHGDRSYHAIDMIHPSLKGSREIAVRVGQLISR